MSADLVGEHLNVSASHVGTVAVKSRDARLRFAAAIWLMLVASGLGGLMKYANRPGDPGTPLTSWPEGSSLLRSTSQPTMLLFAHPKCPCTRATLDELSWVLTRAQVTVDCRVLFFQPQGSGSDWFETDCWYAAQALEGVQVLADTEGRLASCFGVKTSGHVLLYDRQGRLAFQGGITPSRGHRGDNPGRTSLLALLSEPSARSISNVSLDYPVEATCVFGCPLHTPDRAVPIPQTSAEE